MGLSWTWPIAVTKNSGELHKTDIPINQLKDYEEVFTDQQINRAINTAKDLGYELDPVVTAGLV